MPFRFLKRTSQCFSPVLAIALTLGFSPLRSEGAIDVLTYHYDLARTGQNTNETILTPANVVPAKFGKVFSHPVDGYVYGQPLILTGVTIPGQGVHNVAYVVTQHDSVYAFDADNADGADAQPLWQLSFINPAGGVTTVPSGDTGSGDIVPEVGITATPVIDKDSSTIFIEVKTKEHGTWVHRLHALDCSTGAERPNSPIVITASVRGAGDGSSGGVVSFNALREHDRPALTLFTPPGYTNKALFLAYTSHGDNGPYHGWVLGYDATTLKSIGVFNATPNGGLGGIWMSGNGLAVDNQGNMFAETGNGSYSETAKNYGDSFLKVAWKTNAIYLADYFTPYNQAALNAVDEDLGSGGNMVLPDEVGSTAHPHLLVGSGKEGRIYLVDRDGMGRYNTSNDNQIVQWLGPGTIGGAWSSPAYFNGVIYYQGSGDVMKAFAISNGKINGTPLSTSGTGFGFPGATPVISANGSSNAIAWAIQTDGYNSKGPSVLHAYVATNLQTELWNSSMSGTRDTAGWATKFTVPVVANGKVYIGTGNEFDVYGVATWTADPLVAPNGAVFTNSVNVAITDGSPNAAIFYTIDGSTPTQASTRYTGPFVLTNSAAVKARAFAPGSAGSAVVTATFIVSTSLGSGTGLFGQYWANQAASFAGTPRLTRVDPGINFDWNNQGPDPSIGTVNYTVRWSGTVQAQFTEAYTFYVTADDGVRLYVNGQKVVDAWYDQAPTEYNATVNLQAGAQYKIQVDYYQRGGGAEAILSWSSPSTAKQVIPTSQLYPPVFPPVVNLSVFPIDSVIAGPASLTMHADATSPNSTIQSVQFLLGSTPLQTISNAPYTFTTTGITPGTYALYAVAADANGNSTKSSPWNFVVVASTNTSPYGLTNRPAFAKYLGFSTNAADPLPKLLSKTGAFADTPSMKTAPGLLSYSVNAPFWSDGALKKRWMGVPYDGGLLTPANQIAYSQDNNWDFPAGTVFVKHFDLATNDLAPGSTRRLETRLLVYAGAGAVYGATYRWRADGSDADLVANPATESIAITTAAGVRTQQWYYPGPTDCLTCHTTAAGGVLGASKTRQLNGPSLFGSAQVVDNQIRALNRAGYLNPALEESIISSLPRYAPASDLSASVETRARSFLDVNCAYCHQPGGTGRAQFDLRIITPLAQANVVNGPVTANFGVPGAKAVVPGDELRSIIYRRVAATNTLEKMPPIARNEVDFADLAVLGQWIDSLYPPAPAIRLARAQGLIFATWPTNTPPYFLQVANTPDPAAWQPGPTPSVSRTNFLVQFPKTNHWFLRLTSQAPIP
jgi:uncharacterized repeat protein (TIGR03806 family)